MKISHSVIPCKGHTINGYYFDSPDENYTLVKHYMNTFKDRGDDVLYTLQRPRTCLYWLAILASLFVAVAVVAALVIYVVPLTTKL